MYFAFGNAAREESSSVQSMSEAYPFAAVRADRWLGGNTESVEQNKDVELCWEKGVWILTHCAI